MKRIFLFLLMFLLIASVIPFSEVFADSNACVLLRANNTAKRGEMIYLSVILSGSNMNVSGLQGTLNYDSSVLDFKGYSIKQFGWSVSDYSPTTGVFLTEIKEVTNQSAIVTQSSEIVSIEFKVKDNATLGNTTITVKDIVASGTSLISNTESKVIEITENNQETTPTQIPTQTPTQTPISVVTPTQAPTQAPSTIVPLVSPTPVNNVTPTATSNTSSNKNTSNYENKSNQNQNSNTSNSQSKANSNVPYAGENDGIIHIIIFLGIVAVISFVGFVKYRDVV